MPDPIGNISNLISKKSPVRQRAPSRIKVLEGRVATLESALATLLEEVLALRASVERFETSPSKETNATPKTKTEKPEPTDTAPPSKAAKSKPKQPWDDPQRLAEITQLADRILQANTPLTKAETAERFNVNTKLAGQTLAWMVMKKTMLMHTPEPTKDNPDPKNVFSPKK